MRDQRITIRLSLDEMDTLRSAAAIAQISAAEYARRCILRHRITARTDVRMYHLVRQIGGLLKHLYGHDAGSPEADAARVALGALTHCARAIERTLIGDGDTDGDR